LIVRISLFGWFRLAVFFYRTVCSVLSRTLCISFYSSLDRMIGTLVTTDCSCCMICQGTELSLPGQFASWSESARPICSLAISFPGTFAAWLFRTRRSKSQKWISAFHLTGGTLPFLGRLVQVDLMTLEGKCPSVSTYVRPSVRPSTESFPISVKFSV